MILLKMQASFGTLQHETLELGDGLNILQAPNEGGKSTWTAFLRAMLYGLNTKQRDRQGYIAEKNRYQPWSGAAMEGILELLWQGKEITLRRGAKGSVPFGRFEAVYTKTGEPVPGFTGENAGELLLGVPREVYERSAFIGQGAVAIDGTPALEARIAALCSSGEEDVSYTQVERRLRDWQNRRKHNKTGLIPKLEGERATLEDTLLRQGRAHRLAEEARRELEKLEQERAVLEQETAAHQWRARQERRRKYEAATAALETAQAEVDALQNALTQYGTPPDRATLRKAQEDLNYLNTIAANRKLAESQVVEARQNMQAAGAAAVDNVFPDMTTDEAWGRASADAALLGEYTRQRGRKRWGIWLLATAALLAASGCAAWFLIRALPLQLLVSCAAPVVFSAIWWTLEARRNRKLTDSIQTLLARYDVEDADGILRRASDYRERCVVAAEAEKKLAAVTEALEQLTIQRDTLKEQLLSLAHTFAPTVTDVFGVSAAISRTLDLEEKCTTAQVRLEGARRLVEQLPWVEECQEAAIEPLEPRFDPAETAARLSRADGERARLQSALAMAQGELHSLGDPVLFQTRREALSEELERRQGEYDAIALALEELEQAHAELQARFSPVLNQRAGALMGRLTGQKYHKVVLDRQFEATAEETGGLMPRRALTLSQGTADQLYLAVRLAVCRTVLPQGEHVPLVLDDALVSFDDKRLAMTLDVLAELAEQQQVLLFTCHGRETLWAEETGRGRTVRLQS